jgi:hypothetical protein
MGQVKIHESSIDLTNGRKGKIAILIYEGIDDPVAKLNFVVSEYAGNIEHNQFIEITRDNLWVRVIISGINELNLDDFDPSKHIIR